MEELESQDTQEALIQKAKESLKDHCHAGLLLGDSLEIPTKGSIFGALFSREKVCMVKMEKDEEGSNQIKVSKLS